MILLLDTDILIDVALDRSPHAEPAGELLDALEQHPGIAFIAWHTISNFYYLVAPTRGRNDTKAFLLDLVRFAAVAQTTTESLRYAAGLQMKDFEDAMQVAAAVACGAEVIATRNIRDYANAPRKGCNAQVLVTRVFLVIDFCNAPKIKPSPGRCWRDDGLPSAALHRQDLTLYTLSTSVYDRWLLYIPRLNYNG